MGHIFLPFLALCHRRGVGFNKTGRWVSNQEKPIVFESSTHPLFWHSFSALMATK
jgi:hypothetical protein